VEMDLWHKFARRPGGRLEAPGVWPGDIPIETHRGLWPFYGVLLKSQSGDIGGFHVITASESHDWSVHWLSAPRRREIATCRPTRQRLLPGKCRCGVFQQNRPHSVVTRRRHFSETFRCPTLPRLAIPLPHLPGRARRTSPAQTSAASLSPRHADRTLLAGLRCNVHLEC